MHIIKIKKNKKKKEKKKKKKKIKDGLWALTKHIILELTQDEKWHNDISWGYFAIAIRERIMLEIQTILQIADVVSDYW